MNRPKILIVDDLPQNIDVLHGVLMEEYDLFGATTGREALLVAAAQHPDLIILDIMMPGMDGYEVCAALKADTNTRDIPVLFITARTDFESETRGFSCGGEDFIPKPFNAGVVRARVRMHLELARHRHRLEELVCQRTRELAQARDAAEHANRAKTLFLDNMGHEIRTPLTIVMGTGFLLNKEVSTEKGKNLVAMNQRAAERLLGLLNDILTYARIESDQIRIDAVDFELSPLLERSLGGVRDEAAHKGLELAAEIDPLLPLRLNGDPIRLRQILDNLLGNAVKFTEEGRVMIRVCQIRRHKGEVTLRVDVEDQGIGMDDDVQAGLFQLFTQGDNSATRAYGGTGLGLALCKRLVALMGGDIGFTTAPGKGSIFWFTVRLPVVAATEPEGRQAEAAVAALDRLLADDDAQARLFWEEARHSLTAVLGNRLNSFDAAMEVFDFEGALRLLREAVTVTPERSA